MSKINLQTLGFTDKFAAEATLYSNLFAGRVTAQYKEFYRVMTEAGELLAEVSGKLRFNAAALSAFPAVGDFVMLDRTDNTEGMYGAAKARLSVRRPVLPTLNRSLPVISIRYLFVCP